MSQTSRWFKRLALAEDTPAADAHVGRHGFDMKNHFHHVVADAERNNWCVRPWCTTCGAHDFRTAVASIADLQTALESIDLDELTSHRDWCDALRVTAIDHRISIDWGRILSSWLPYAQGHIDFADHVFYYLVNYVPCDRQTRATWQAICVDLALRTKDVSLLESLVRTCGPESANYNDLITAALEQSTRSPRLKDALIKAGLVPSEDDVHREQKRKVAGHNLFGAIRRNDIRAVRALLVRRADLAVRSQEGLTPLEYARSLARADLVTVLESAIAQQVALADADKPRR